MPGKCRPCLRKKTLENVKHSSLSTTDKKCIKTVFEKFESTQWISVDDRLPDPFVSVLGYMTDAGDFPPVREGYTSGGKGFFFPALQDIHPVSHWMPIPEPPKGENNG